MATLLAVLAVAAAVLMATFAGAATLLRAGSIEASGQLEAAGRLSYQGGLLLAVGTVPCGLLLALTGLMAGHAWTYVAGFAAVGGGVAGLLAGLSRKPRPTGWLAVGLVLAAPILASPGAIRALRQFLWLAGELD